MVEEVAMLSDLVVVSVWLETSDVEMVADEVSGPWPPVGIVTLDVGDVVAMVGAEDGNPEVKSSGVDVEDWPVLGAVATVVVSTELLSTEVVAIEEVATEVLWSSVVWAVVAWEEVAVVGVDVEAVSAVELVTSVWVLDHAPQVSLFCSC